METMEIISKVKSQKIKISFFTQNNAAGKIYAYSFFGIFYVNWPRITWVIKRNIP